MCTWTPRIARIFLKSDADAPVTLGFARVGHSQEKKFFGI